jgi:hypothetical protein
MESVTERIVTLILMKVGMEGPRRVIIGRTRRSGNHSYRDVSVEGNAPVACLEDIANALEAWLIERAGSKVEYSGHVLQISAMEDVHEGQSYVVENLWGKGG